MNENSDHYEMLNGILRAHPEGISIQEVADLTGIHRNTAAKYLEVLHSQGEVDVRRVGVSKLFFIGKRVPFTCIIRLYDDPVIGVDRDLQIADLNEPARALIGTDQKSLIGSHVRNLESLLGAGISDTIREVIRGQWCTRENGLRNPTLLLRGVPVKFNDNRTGAAIICIDQDKALAVRSELDRCTDTLEMITRHQTEYIYRLSRDLRYTWVNPAYARLFTLTPDAMIGRRLTLSVPEDERKEILKNIHESSPEGSTIEYRVTIPPGDVRYHQVMCRQDKQAPAEGGYICVGRDITEFKLKEEQFRRFYDGTEEILAERTKELRNLNRQLYREIANREQAEKTLRSIEFSVHHVADLIIWFDTAGTITYTNQSAGTALKLDETGKEVKIFSILNEPPGGDWEIFWDSLRKNQTVFFETMLTATDGRTVLVEIAFNHLINADDEFCCCIARDIHERKQAVAELIESENRFRQLAETIPEIFFLRDIRTRSILYISPAYEQIFGLPLSGIYENADSWMTSVHPGDLDMVRERLRECDRSSCTTEFRIIRPDGTVRWLEIRIFPISDPHNHQYRNVGVIFDITGRRSMEEELRLLHDRLTTVIRATPVSLFNQDSDLRYIWIGQSSIGLTYDEVIGKTDADLFLPEVAERLTTVKQAALKSGKGGYADVEIQHTGRNWTVRMFYEPFRDSAGTITGITVAAIDLTDLFFMKEALRESEEKYRRLFDETNDIGLVFSMIQDGSGRVVDFEYSDLNQHALTLMGREKGEIIGRKVSDLHPDIDPRWLALLHQAAEGRQQVSIDGYSELFHRHVSASAYLTGDRHIGILARDISDLVRASDQVRIQRDLALALAATDDFTEALTLILDAGKKVPGIDSGGIYFMDRDESHLMLRSHFGLNPSFIGSVSSIPVTPHMKERFGSGKAVYYHIDEISEIPPSTKIMIDEGLKMFVVLPILKNNSVYAILNLASHSLGELPPYERPYLEALAAHLGETLARLRRGIRSGPGGNNQEDMVSIQVISQDGGILEGSSPYGREGYGADTIRSLIQDQRTPLLCGEEVSGEVKAGSTGQDSFRVRLRFIPWNGEIAYLAIWKRSDRIIS